MKCACRRLWPCALWLAVAAVFCGAANKPVYIGSRACGACHTGIAMGDGYSLWLYSKHSQAWAVLAKPESKKIAQISGLRQEPQQAAICLGCHATAFSAEGWEKDDEFHTEEGVQCEGCHGPGSEYATEEVMRVPQAFRKAGLLMPTEQDCMNCHLEKGSHVAVLNSPQIDIKKAWRDIDHPMPRYTVSGGIPAPVAPPGANMPGPKYVGSAACGLCHRGREHGHQYSLWRMSKHALAWAVLGTPSAYEIAKKQGVQGEPSRSPQCLKCHTTGQGGAFLASFTVDEGVGCEACHGPGSEYRQEAIMRDGRAADAARLIKHPNRSTCAPCHETAHGRPFNYEAAVKQIVHPTHLPEEAAAPRYKNPLNMALSPDARELYVACEGSDSVIVVSATTRQRIAEIPVGENPADVTFSPDGRLAFVSTRLDDSVSVINVAERKVTRTLAAGDSPHGVLTDKQGRLLYVLNSLSNDISVFDVGSLKLVRTLSAGRGPWSLAMSPDGAGILVTNMYSDFAFRAPVHSESTWIDASRGVVDERLKVDGANQMLGVDWHPSGQFAFATLNRTKSLVPMTQLLQGWTITNGLAIVWRDGKVDELLLDEPGMGFADATDVAFTPDGRYALVTSAGTDRVAVVDVEKLLAILRRSTDYEREHVLPNHLGKAVEYVVKYIPTGNSPRGVLVSRDGRLGYVANALDDSLTVIDLARMKAAGRIDLGGPKEITQLRVGERLFNSANITFRRQFACHSCHPDGHIDGLSYDIEADGIGVSPVDNRTLRGILDTAPFKWEGTNPSLQRQCGPRLAVFFTRLAPFTPEQLAALDFYITTIPRPPNRFRALGAPLTPAQRRGKAIFERTETNDGREIPLQSRCDTCHFPPYYTDRHVHDVGTRQPDDRGGKFDTPQLSNIYDTAPYLHDGIAPTLEEIWTVHNPNDQHGVTNDMTKDQLNDLIEYLKTL